MNTAPTDVLSARTTVAERFSAVSPGDDPEVNEEWNCDKGRFAFTYTTQGDRITTPLIRNADGELIPASWPMALDLVARSFAQARGDAGVLVGGRSTLEDAYAYGKFARVALATNNIDFRIRAHSAEEAGFLSAHVAGRTLEESVTYQDLESAPAALLVALEPEEESPIIFLRLRKGRTFRQDDGALQRAIRYARPAEDGRLFASDRTRK